MWVSQTGSLIKRVQQASLKKTGMALKRNLFSSISVPASVAKGSFGSALSRAHFDTREKKENSGKRRE